MKRFIYYFLHFSYGLLQNILAFVLFVFLFLKDPRREMFFFRSAFVITWKNRYSCGIGNFIFLYEGAQEEVLCHEYGHVIQSLVLGPLYLFVIAIPSFIWCNLFFRFRKRKRIPYRNFYTEKWANSLSLKFLHHRGI